MNKYRLENGQSLSEEKRPYTGSKNSHSKLKVNQQKLVPNIGVCVCVFLYYIIHISLKAIQLLKCNDNINKYIY